MFSFSKSNTKTSTSVPLLGTYIRQASHAGTWYNDDPDILTKEIITWLNNTNNNNNNNVSSSSSSESSTSTSTNNNINNSSTIPKEAIIHGLISPHAGYRFSGSTAAYSYNTWLTSLSLTNNNNNTSSSMVPPSSTIPHTIFIFGPSHRIPLNGLAISGAKEIETPLGNIPVNTSLIQQLFTTDIKNISYRVLSQEEDENEHSLEMHYPLIQYIIQQIYQEYPQLEKNHPINIVPILVGTLTPNYLSYTNLLVPYFRSNSNLNSTSESTKNFFIFSSDFCHWGKRFSYTPINKQFPTTEIYKGIELLDKEGILILEHGNYSKFLHYLTTKKNTICGRNPLLFLLSIMEEMNKQDGNNNTSTTSSSTSLVANISMWKIKFLHYKQSSPVQSMDDSSVSYAAGIIYSTKQ